MDLNKQKELISLAHVRSLSAQCGYSSTEPEVDDDSIDLTVKARMVGRPVRSPSIDLQLKCTSTNLNISDGEISFPGLSLKNYDDLRAENVAAPRYLVVVIVPKRTELWLEHVVHNQLITRQCAYWVSLKGLDEITTDTVTIKIPTQHVLRTSTLQSLMFEASEGR